MNEFGDTKKPLWFTEIGWSSHTNTKADKNEALGVTEKEQGDFLVRAVEMARKSWPRVEVMIVYNDRNRSDSSVRANNLGILYADLKPKPAYEALRSHLTKGISPYVSWIPCNRLARQNDPEPRLRSPRA